jgi:hypothetical protein
MFYIQHRVNSAAQLRQTPPEYGVELDLRDRGDRLILSHDPFGDGEDFDAYLLHFRHRLIILNIKSERIEPRVLEVIHTHMVGDYFFLDCTFPMIRWLASRGERKIAVRFSEYEPVESALALAGQVEWVWADCFSKMPFTDETYAKLRPYFKLCVVSPELQGRSTDTIPGFSQQLRQYSVDAVCTKVPDVWRQALGE